MTEFARERVALNERADRIAREAERVYPMFERLLACVDAVLTGDALNEKQRLELGRAFCRCLDVSPTAQVCEAIDQLKQRGLGVSIVKCGGLELQLHQLHTAGKASVDEVPTDDDPIFDAVR